MRWRRAGLQGEDDIGTIKGEETLAELAQLHDVRANQITAWKVQLLACLVPVPQSGNRRRRRT